MSNDIIYSWTFSNKKEKGKYWYIITIALVIGIPIWSIFTGQYGLSFLIILVAGVYFFVDNNSPDIINVEITNEGIRISNTLYNYGRISHYSIVYDKSISVFLRLTLNKKGFSKIDININDEVANIIKTILPNFIKEAESEEISSSEKLINFLKL